MVAVVAGPSRWDASALGEGLCLPHFGLGTSAATAERFFATGNERTPFNYNPGGTDMSSGTGFHITKEDKLMYLVELMNMNMEDKVVYVTMTYDFIEGKPLNRLESPNNYSRTDRSSPGRLEQLEECVSRRRTMQSE